MCAQSLSHVQLFAAPRTVAFLCPWDFPGKNTGVGCRFLLQGIFLTQGLNPRLLHLLNWPVDSLPPCHPGGPPCLHSKESKKRDSNTFSHSFSPGSSTDASTKPTGAPVFFLMVFLPSCLQLYGECIYSRTYFTIFRHIPISLTTLSHLYLKPLHLYNIGTY